MDVKPEKKYECSKCSKAFKANYELTQHMVTHDPGAEVKCEVCGKIYRNKFALSTHKSKLHNTMVGRRRFPCTLYGKEFQTKAELDQHILTHPTEKPHKCSTCGRSFTHNSGMRLHEMTHLEKSVRDVFQCDVCPQTFFGRSEQQRHIRRVHENQRNCPCTVCDKRFSNSYHLKRHVEAVHETDKERIHACDKCWYRSHSKHNLANHSIRHNPARVYPELINGNNDITVILRKTNLYSLLNLEARQTD
ncbi:zinc finger protein 724-like [Folsomia candida]|uniref:zinc finger protein 724-like n=1 Tax=Folsomia candida TaxID=158441 RepID=UPI0016051B6F|nr:zinc finger protein 724-like [Folsomia candida]XP_035713503.1 zinc finger protein 724-like [Folsomia candida]XP_035713504.1 zinc finger protein 724-like [Folsomia candida]XP_035713505.1 zinc finger protein 724-like [Folsomia candida]XP_035713507.1 zinc finger protein 724-like [Folsomia candida]